MAEATGTGSTSVGAVGVRQAGRHDWSRWSDAVAAETRVGPRGARGSGDLGLVGIWRNPQESQVVNPNQAAQASYYLLLLWQVVLGLAEAGRV